MSLRTIITIHNNAILLLGFTLFLSLFVSGCPKKADPTPVPRTYELPELDTGLIDLPEED